MFKPLIGAVNGATVCLFLERDNVLEVTEEAVWGPCEYAGGLSSGSGGGVGSYITQVRSHITVAGRGRTYRLVAVWEGITSNSVKNHVREGRVCGMCSVEVTCTKLE